VLLIGVQISRTILHADRTSIQRVGVVTDSISTSFCDVRKLSRHAREHQTQSQIRGRIDSDRDGQ